MPKMKRHKGLAKRVKVTANGKIKFKHPFTGHLLSGRSANRKRRLRQGVALQNPKLAAKMRRALLA